MDKLKEIMALKKPKDKVVFNKNVIDQQKQTFVKELLENKKAKEDEEQRRLQEIDDFYGKPKKMVKLQSLAPPPIPVQEVKEQLRKLYQPATLFGQNVHRRYDRLMRVKKFHDEHPNQDMKLYDEEFIKKIKQNEQYEQLDAKYRDELIEPKILGDISIRKKKEAMVLKQSKKTMVEMCDKIYLWLNKMIKGWGQSLEQKYQNAKVNKSKFQLLEQTTHEIQSFIQVLKERKGDLDMIESIYHIMNCCILRQYVQANSRYIELSIGSAPWPMGVAMLGITVRRNSERLSYVLDNQMTRKWMQAIKRLISVSQQLYPNEDRMKMVGYTMNSLA